MKRNIVIGVASGVGALTALGAIIASLVFARKRRRRKAQTDLTPPTSPPSLVRGLSPGKLPSSLKAGTPRRRLRRQQALRPLLPSDKALQSPPVTEIVPTGRGKGMWENFVSPAARLGGRMSLAVAKGTTGFALAGAKGMWSRLMGRSEATPLILIERIYDDGLEEIPLKQRLWIEPKDFNKKTDRKIRNERPPPTDEDFDYSGRLLAEGKEGPRITSDEPRRVSEARFDVLLDAQRDAVREAQNQGMTKEDIDAMVRQFNAENDANDLRHGQLALENMPARQGQLALENMPERENSRRVRTPSPPSPAVTRSQTRFGGHNLRKR